MKKYVLAAVFGLLVGAIAILLFSAVLAHQVELAHDCGVILAGTLGGLSAVRSANR